MKQIEIEYKTLLTQEEFDRLSQTFSHVPLISQTNHYFDNSDRQLRAAKLSLRIRTLVDRAELTLKIPQEVGNMEYNWDLSLEEAKVILTQNQLPLNPVTQLLIDQGFDLQKIISQGSLTTHRRETQLPIGLLALDENHYSGQKDYELELEVSDPEVGQKAFHNFLDQEKIRFKYAKSKVVRFLQTLSSNQ